MREHRELLALCLHTLGGSGALAPLSVLWRLGVVNISNGFTVVRVGTVTVPAVPNGPS